MQESSWDSDRLPIYQVLPHDGRIYPESETKFVENGWSYEVETDREIYRISTIPSDFIGSNQDDWTTEMKNAYRDGRRGYKGQESFMDDAEKYYLYLKSTLPDEHAVMMFLLKVQFDHAMYGAESRLDFLKRWPNAYNSKTENHWSHILQVLNRAKETQSFAAITLWEPVKRKHEEEMQAVLDMISQHWRQGEMKLRNAGTPKIRAMLASRWKETRETLDMARHAQMEALSHSPE